MAEKLGDSVLTLRTDATQMLTGMASAQKKAMAFGTKLSATGKMLSMRLTLPLIAAGGAAIKLAADFGKSMSEIVGLVGISSEQVERWSEQIKILGPELGKSPKELADALFFVTSAGLRGAEAMEVLTMSAKASAAGMGETKVIADAVTSAMNAYGKENLSAADATDILVATVREGKVEAASLAGALGKVIPVASAMGIEFNEVGATIAALTRVGADAAMATTALRGVMSGILKPTTEAEEILTKYGTSAKELRKKIDEEGLLAVLFELKERFGENTDEAAKVFGNIRALTGVLSIVGDNADEVQAIWASMRDNVGDTNLAFEAAEQTLTQKLNKTMASFKVALVEIGEVLGPIVLPFLEKLASYIKDLATRFGDLSPETQNFLLIIAGVAAALGPALMMIGLLTKAVAVLMTVVSSAALPWILLGAAVAAIAILVIKNWDTVKEAAIRLFNGLKDIWTGINIVINANAAKIYHAVKDWLVDKFKDMTAWLEVTWGKISNVYIKARNFIVELFGGEPIPPVDISALEAQLDGLDKRREEESAKTRAQIEEAIVFGTEMVAEGGVEIAELATEIGTGIADTFVGAWDKMSGMFKEMFGKGGTVPETTKDTGEALEDLGDLAKDTGEETAEALKEISDERMLEINAEVEAAVAAYNTQQEAFTAMEAEKRRIADENEKAEATALLRRQENIESFSENVVGSFARTFGSMMTKVVEGTATIWDAFKEAGKEAIAAVLEALGQMAIVEAALAVAEAIMAFPNFAKMAAAAGAAIKFTLAAALAYGAAGAVRGLQFGGVIEEPVVGFGTQSGATYALAEAGPERVTSMDEEEGGSLGMIHLLVNLNGETLSEFVTEAIRDRQIIVDVG